jgi:hypothetical protein
VFPVALDVTGAVAKEMALVPRQLGQRSSSEDLVECCCGCGGDNIGRTATVRDAATTNFREGEDDADSG